MINGFILIVFSFALVISFMLLKTKRYPEQSPELELMLKAFESLTVESEPLLPKVDPDMELQNH